MQSRLFMAANGLKQFQPKSLFNPFAAMKNFLGIDKSKCFSVRKPPPQKYDYEKPPP
jgi:hypothetical protein